MRIKRDLIFKNEYIRAGNVWVRNFTKDICQPIDINELFTASDISQITINENANRSFDRRRISEQNFYFPKVLIVSDGFEFDKRQFELRNLPSDVVIFSVNQSLSKWKLMESNPKRPINLYIANNPYKDCLNYISRKTKYFPSCVASSRTYIPFVEGYQGNMYVYEPTPSLKFGSNPQDLWYVDDYRSPVCAAISLAHRFGVEKLALFCCDEAFADERPAAEQLKNGLWQYPQHFQLHQIIEANLYWLTHQEERPVEVVDYSSGAEYKNATYICTEEALKEFFADDLETLE